MDNASHFPADMDHFVLWYTVRFITLYDAILLFVCSGRLNPELENSDLKFL